MRKRPSGPSSSVSARSASTIGSVCGGRPSRRAAYASCSLAQPSSSRVSSAASIASSAGMRDRRIEQHGAADAVGRARDQQGRQQPAVGVAHHVGALEALGVQQLDQIGDQPLGVPRRLPGRAAVAAQVGRDHPPLGKSLLGQPLEPDAVAGHAVQRQQRCAVRCARTGARGGRLWQLLPGVADPRQGRADRVLPAVLAHRSRSRTPSASASTSWVTLSVSSSYSGSPTRTAPPSSTRNRISTPDSISSPSRGTVTGVAMGADRSRSWGYSSGDGEG